MPDGLNPLLLSAIQERRVLSLIYKGRPVDVEPYTYGRMLTGNDFLYGWQRSGTFSNWRFFWLHLARGIRLSEVTFEGARADYSTSGLGHVSEVYAQLEGASAPWLTVPDQDRATKRTSAQLFASEAPRASHTTTNRTSSLKTG
jgi:hypothetical protein